MGAGSHGARMRDVSVPLRAEPVDVYEPREEGPTALRRNTRTGGFVTVGFLDEHGNAVLDEDVVFEPVPGGPASRLIWR